MTEDLLRYEIVLREQADEGSYLVFPSQSTRENPDLPDPEGSTVIFRFEGPILNIYSTLAVRLSHSGLFKKKELWKNAITYKTNIGGTYGIFFNNIGEGSGELTLFFDKATSEETRIYFEEYVYTHLKRRVLPESLQRKRVFSCGNCGAIVTDQIVRLRLERGYSWLDCSVCSERISLVERGSHSTSASASIVSAMDDAADTQVERETAKSTLQGKIEIQDFDVFLCHHGIDKQAVKQIGEKLKSRGYLPWLDEWELPPGRSWQRLLESQIKQIKSAAVFVGKSGIGPWQQHEIDAFLREFLRRDCPVIPVLLADVSEKPGLPIFLEGVTWVDFREQDPDPLEQLIWGITGKRSARR